MDDWLNMISYIIKSLIEAGYSIEDKLYLLRIGGRGNSESRYISTLYPSNVYYSYEYGIHDIVHCLGKIASFNYPYNTRYISRHILLAEIKKIYQRALKL